MSGLKEALKTAGLTKTKLAVLMGVNEKTIRRLGDDITPDVERALANFKQNIFSHAEPAPKCCEQLRARPSNTGKR